MIILGIESSCDETACAIVKDGREILSSVIYSQHDVHETFGGVVPELACRRHVDVMLPVIEKALEEAGMTLNDIDALAVTEGPGLVGALMIGIQAAKALKACYQLPLIGVNHIEAHLFAALMQDGVELQAPAIGVILSGGHTQLVEIQEIGKYKLLGETIDDAIGEAFDKVARILGLPYPGGPHIERLAKLGNPKSYPFNCGNVKGRPLDFSYSGLKTAVLYAVKGQNGKINDSHELDDQMVKDIAASFQKVAFDAVISKVQLAKEKIGAKSLLFGGGVTNNLHLRERFEKEVPDSTKLWPTQALSLDNAAMIAGLAYHKLDHADREVFASPNFNLIHSADR